MSRDIDDVLGIYIAKIRCGNYYLRPGVYMYEGGIHMRMLKGLICLATLALLLAACSSESGNGGQAVPPTTGNAGTGQGRQPSGEENGNNPGQKAGEAEAGKEEETPPKPDGTDADGTAGQLYAVAFAAIMELDEALNHEMKYIAVDLSEMTQLTEDDRTYIFEHLQSFGTDIRNRTFEQLKEEENLEKNNLVLKGVLLRIEKVEIEENSALIEGSKYRSGTGAIGAKITLKLENGAWKVSGAETTWIS